MKNWTKILFIDDKNKLFHKFCIFSTLNFTKGNIYNKIITSLRLGFINDYKFVKRPIYAFFSFEIVSDLLN